MTPREKLADWISGGKLAEARKEASNSYAVASLNFAAWLSMARREYHRRTTLEAILAATKDGKSGTAKKVARMAREGLK
jgi:hypothetical protein